MVADPKLAFASPAWIDAARAILEALVAEHGEPGRRFSVCERFTDAPPDVAPSGRACWWFQIDGRTVSVAAGKLDGADVTVTADYAAALPTARLVYTPEIQARRAQARARGSGPGVTGDMGKAPPYLVELHNRLAVLTA
jgi:hypothetical protein